MNLYVRLLLALWSGIRADRLQHNAVFKKSFRVWPHDLDAFGHMNNGRYLQIMDVARAEWMVRTGVLGTMRNHGWTALLGGGATRFRHSLSLWQSYEVDTRLLCWDQRWFYFEHSFLDLSGRCLAVGVSQAAIRDKKGWVCANRVAAEVAPDQPSPPMPVFLRDWLNLDEAMFCHAQQPQMDRTAQVEVAL